MRAHAPSNSGSTFIAALLLAGAVIEPAMAQTSPDQAPVTLDFLRESVSDAERRLAAPAAKTEFKVEETGGLQEPKELPGAVTPRVPKGASAFKEGSDAKLIDSDAPPVGRSKPKAGAGLVESPVFDPRDWVQLSFVGGSYTPEAGIGDTLLKAAESRRGESTFAFLVMESDPDEAAQQKLQELGVEVLGRHDDALKIRLPLNREVIDAVLKLPGVHFIGYARPEQKIAPDLERSLSTFSNDAARFPVIVNLFVDDKNGVFAKQIQDMGVEIVSYDSDLNAYTALASLEEIRKLAEQDFVLFIEVEKPSRSGHNESTPTNSVDYIRAAGFTGGLDGVWHPRYRLHGWQRRSHHASGSK